MLTSRGGALSGTAVASLLGAEFTRAVPAHTAATLAPQALAASSSLSTTALFANTIQTMSTFKSTSITAAAVLALAAIPISQQLAEAKRLRSEVEAIGAPAGEARTTGTLSALPSKTRSLGEPLTRSLLDELAAPVSHRELVKQLMAAGRLSHMQNDPWAANIAFAQLTKLSEDELAEFFNAFDDYPASAQDKKLTQFVLQVLHPGGLETYQDTLERMMRRAGKDRPFIDVMTIWTRDDPDAAIAWFREKTATGEILGKGLSTKFEMDTFESLVVTLARLFPSHLSVLVHLSSVRLFQNVVLLQCLAFDNVQKRHVYC